MGVPPESLMLPPQMLTDLYWRRGHFERTGRVEVDRRSIGYGFYVIDPLCREDRFEDEWGRPLPAEPRLLGTAGLATDVEGSPFFRCPKGPSLHWEKAPSPACLSHRLRPVF